MAQTTQQLTLRPTLRRDQQALLRRADQSADAVEKAVRGVWNRLILAIKAGGDWFTLWQSCRRALAGLHRLPDILAADFLDAAKHAHTTTQEHIETLLREDVNDFISPGVPIFHAIDPATVLRLVYAGGWRERLETLTQLANPDALASTIATAWMQGKTVTEIARLIQPAVQDVQTSARRVARTYGMQVGHGVQMEMYEQLDGVIGYQIHCQHVPASRHWHIERDKTIYYREPAASQKGFRQMPRPPLEAPDPSERPLGTSEIAFNCLCWLTPVFYNS